MYIWREGRCCFFGRRGGWELAVGDGEDLTTGIERFGLAGVRSWSLLRPLPLSSPTANCPLPRRYQRVLLTRCKRRSPGPDTRMLYSCPAARPTGAGQRTSLQVNIDLEAGGLYARIAVGPPVYHGFRYSKGDSAKAWQLATA